MDSFFLSSGELVADRRADYARMLDEAGDAAAAADLMAQALDLVPRWAAGWALLARYCETAGQADRAAGAWREVLVLDRDGMFGAELKLAALGAAAAPGATAVGYVTALFDGYAREFDRALMGRLHYVVPGLLDRLIDDAAAGPGYESFARALDLGCGTGLMGERLRRRVSHLTGIDLSAGMLAQTARKGIYDALSQDDLLAYLEACAEPADLVTAADVFAYCGALPPVFSRVFAALAPGGLFAFSLERFAGEGACVLQPSLRYAHGAAATREALLGAGFEILRFEEAVIRHDRDEPLTGLLVLARRPGPEDGLQPPVGTGDDDQEAAASSAIVPAS